MASTYSASLRLELMATGDQSGTWGTTTNTNLGTLLEQAITGYLSVAQGDVANLTLTTVNGGTDQARNAVVNLTGAMTANRNVVVQTAAKVYLIKNNTTGGFNVTAKTAAGTGVEIAPGTARWVYSDGTNVVDGQPGLWMGYATTATAAGTTVLTVGSAYYQYFTGATTQTITLPVASTLTLGQAFYFVNLSSGALTVNSSGGNLVATIGASSSAIVQAILTSGTSAASWNAVAVNLSAYLPLAGGTMTGQLINTGSSVGYTPLLLTSTEAAAAAGPIIDLYRNSASPAANDIMGQAIWNGQNSTPAKIEYASIQSTIISATAASEASTLDFYTKQAGSRVLGLSLVGSGALMNNPVAGYMTTATAAGTTTLTVASTQQQYFTGSTTQTVQLPVTSTLQLGWSYRIVNNSTGVVTINSSGGNTILAIGGVGSGVTFGAGAPGTEIIVTCISTAGTGTASWSYEYIAPTTPWITYTPTFTGFGTAASVSIWSRRVGGNLEIRGKFTIGTPTATEARLTLGYNGVSANVTSDATKVTAIQLAGPLIVDSAGASSFFVLIESNVSYLTFGLQNGSTAALTKQNGNAPFGTGTTVSFLAFIPITGW